MAGTLRYILNKPQMGVTTVTLDGSVRNSSEGEASYDGSVVVNLPIGDNIAARFVAFDAKDGGFIDNVPGKTIDNDTKAVALYGRSPSGWGTMDNSDVVEKDINDYNIDGWRAAVRWEINDQWAATASYLSQSSVSGSYNGFDPNVGDLEEIRYNEEYYNVDIDVSSLVIEGDLGFAQLVSATSYYDSESDFDQDITNYHKSYSAYYCIEYAGDAAYYAPYYFATENGFMYAEGTYCNSPTVEGDYFAAFRKTYQTIALVKKFDYQLRVIHWIGLWVHSMRQVITAGLSIGVILQLMKTAEAHPMSFISRQFHWLITSGRGETHSQMRRKIGMPIAQKILNRQLSLVK